MGFRVYDLHELQSQTPQRNFVGNISGLGSKLLKGGHMGIISG